jgi:hypothetical protein
MQIKAQAAGERKRWAIDTENVGRTLARRRATNRGSRCWDALANTGSAARET